MSGVYHKIECHTFLSIPLFGDYFSTVDWCALPLTFNVYQIGKDVSGFTTEMGRLLKTWGWTSAVSISKFQNSNYKNKKGEHYSVPYPKNKIQNPSYRCRFATTTTHIIQYMKSNTINKTIEKLHRKHTAYKNFRRLSTTYALKRQQQHQCRFTVRQYWIQG